MLGFRKSLAGRVAALTALFEWGGVLIAAAIIVIPLRIFVAQPFVVSGSSMDPTIKSGEYLVIDRLTYRFVSPERGDVIVMQYPLDSSIFFVKRIVGLPGDTISVKDGHVYVLGKDGEVNAMIPDSFVEHPMKKPESQVVTLMKDEFFVMGDNREASSDSRQWGPLRNKYIIGRAVARLYPFDAITILPGDYSL